MKLSIKKKIWINSDIETLKAFTFDLSKWKSWSPWYYVEPTANFTIEDTELLQWSGHVIGEGKLETTKRKNNSIELNLYLKKPYKTKAKITIKIGEFGIGQMVVWNVQLSIPFYHSYKQDNIRRAFSNDFIRGLRRLKYLSEGHHLPCSIGLNSQIISSNRILLTGFDVSSHEHELKQSTRAYFNKLDKSSPFAQQRVKYTIRNSRNYKTGYYDYTCAYERSIKDSQIKRLTKFVLPAHKALKVVLMGNHDFLEDAWNFGKAHLKANKLSLNPDVPCYEKYITNHSTTAPNKNITELYLPVKSA